MRLNMLAWSGTLKYLTSVSDRRRLSGNVAALTLLQLLTYAAPLITVPFLARVLGPTEYGVLCFAQSVTLHLDFLTDYGFALTSTRSIAVARDRPEEIARVFWTTLAAKSLIMSVCAVILLLAIGAMPKLYAARWLYAGCFLSVIGSGIFPVWFFQGIERMTIFAAAFGVARLITIPLLLLFVLHPDHAARAAAIQGSVEIVSTLIVIPVLWRHVGWRQPRTRDVLDSLRQAWPLFVSSSALFLCTSSTPVILGITAGAVNVGLYSAADKLIKAAIAALNPLSQALYPHIAAQRTLSPRSAIGIIRGSLAISACLGLGLSAAIFTLAGPMCRLVFGPSFSASAELLRYLAPLPMLFALMNVLGTQTMVVFGMDAAMSRIMLRCAAAGISLTLVLSVFFGARGVAVASVTTVALMLVFMARAIKARGIPVFGPAPKNSLEWNLSLQSVEEVRCASLD